MPLGRALRNILINDVGVAAIVVARVYPLSASQNATLPCIIYSMVGEETHYSADGEVGMTTVRVQFDMYAEETADVPYPYDTAVSLADKVRLAISGYSGTASAVVIRSILHESTRDLTEPTVDKGEKVIVRRSSDYEVTHDQTVP